MTDHKKELEDFVYTISHDLNAPLRHIREFSKILLQTLAGKLSDEEREFFGYILESSAKADNIMDALLQYSRLTTQIQPFKPFDAPELLEEVIHSLKDEIEKKKAVIEVSDIPDDLFGDRNHLGKLFYVLIKNALVFQNGNAVPKFSISAKLKEEGREEGRGETYVFSIVDNGIGIAPENHEQVFKIFKRLDPQTYPDGMGVGLTMAKKIVEQHDGDIWLESILDEGTTVHFTLNPQAVTPT